jgi:hypothetical protein
MQMVKIQIPDKDECAKGFSALIRRGRVDCFRDNVFIVAEPALEVLETLGVRYVELGRGGPDVSGDEWVRRLRQVATDCGVALSDAAVSSEELYE